ncbi:MAG: amidase family protein [Polyangiales bacterium]
MRSTKNESGETLGPLAGVPIAIKDNLCTRGVATTCASKILEGYVPYDAHVIEALRKADAILIGKTNLDEFAMGSSNEKLGVRRRPKSVGFRSRPGGSSGGRPPRWPRDFRRWRWKRHGRFGLATGVVLRRERDQTDVRARPDTGSSRLLPHSIKSARSQTPSDCALLLSVIAGKDSRDATSVEHEVPRYEDACDASERNAGVVRDQIEQLQDQDTKDAMQAVENALRAAGVEIVDVSLPHAKHAVSVYYLIATAEASSNLARFDGVRYGLRVDGGNLNEMYDETRSRGFGAEVRRRIMLGTYALSAGYYDAFYLKAQKVRTLIRSDYDRALGHCDAILTPTSPTPAFRLGEKTSDPLQMYLADIFTLPPSLAGLPAMSTPCGLSADRLPIGVQLTGAAFSEQKLVALSQEIENTLGLLETVPDGMRATL